MTRLRPDTRRPMPDLNDVLTTKRGIGSSGARDGKKNFFQLNIIQHPFYGKYYYQCTKLKDVEKSYKVEILGHIEFQHVIGYISSILQTSSDVFVLARLFQILIAC